MDSITYTIILGIVFFTGIFVFTYFETPRKRFNKGIRQLRNMGMTNLKTNKTLTIPSQNKNSGLHISKNNQQCGIGVFVHEY